MDRRSNINSFKDLYPKNAADNRCPIDSFETMRSLHFTCTALRTELEKSKIKLQQYAQNNWQEPCEEKHLNAPIVETQTPKMSSHQKITDCVEDVDEWNTTCTEEQMELKICDKMECESAQETYDPKSQDDGTSNDDSAHCKEKSGETDSETSQLNYQMKVSDQCGADTTTGDEGDEDDSTTVDDIELIFTTEDVSDLPTGMDESLVSFSDAEEQGENDDDEDDDDRDKENQCTKPVLLKFQQSRFDTPAEVLRDLPTQISYEDDSMKENIAEEVKSVKAKEVKFKVSDVRKKHHRSGKKGANVWNEDRSGNKQNISYDSRNKQFTKFEEEYPLRPILQKSNLPKRENEAQTVITAIPKQWKSENYLAHKFSTFTTLPSKFSLPSSAFRRKQSSPATLQYTTSTSFKTPMLSDLNFTSMFPEFTRSVDRLNSCLEEENSGYYTSKQFQQTVQNTWYENLGVDNQPLPRENIIIPPTNMRRWSHHWTQDAVGKRPYTSILRAHNSHHHQNWSSVPTSPVKSYDQVRGSLFYPATVDDTLYTKDTKRSSWSSLPTSPHGFQKTPGHHQNVLYNIKGTNTASFEKEFADGYKPRKRWTKVHFRGMTGSLPNLSGFDGDSSGSTESLLDEADEFIRSAVDMQLNTEEWEAASRRRRMRRQSEPNCKVKGLKNLSSRPFIPKSVTDLKVDDVVKVIHIGGLVGVGKVSYAGIPPGKLEPYIGVELESSFGDSDGVFEGRRYFVCEPKCAVFVPFKKVILAWSAR